MPKPLSGIYVIRHRDSGDFYVGSSKDIFHRFESHRRDLRRGKHGNYLLQAAWDRFGERAFEFSVVEIVDGLDRLRIREQEWIDRGAPLNVSKRADRALFPRPITPALRRALSVAAKKIWSVKSIEERADATARARSAITSDSRRRAGSKLVGNKHSKGLIHTDAVRKIMSKRQLEAWASSSAEARRKGLRERNRINAKKRSPLWHDVVCAHCGTIFSTKHRKYCSQSCVKLGHYRDLSVRFAGHVLSRRKRKAAEPEAA